MTNPDIGAQIEKIAMARIQSDRLQLPAMPAIAAKAMAMTRDPNINAKKLVALIEKDAVLTARVIRSASSAAMGSAVASLSAAVNRLGMGKLRQVMVEHASQELFTSRDPRISSRMDLIWKHSIAVAVAARDLASLTHSTEVADVAYVGGLLHDVGKAVVAAFLLEAERTLGRRGPWIGSEEWGAVIARAHRPIGVALAEKWTLPYEVVEVIRDCGDFDNADRLSAVNFVRFANALAKREGIYEGAVDMSDNEALIMIGRSLLSLDDEVVTRITQALGARVEGSLQA
jgi:putative nucleotidyltransferase with HDIG domain